ncbi:MAG: T9SS type A sorting domain-containing protein [Bacteroidota bacterium]
MKKLSFLPLLGVFLFFSSSAQVNFSEHIAPIIYENCTSCHRPGEIGPFSLTNYEETAGWAGMIQYVTAIKYMPPWQPDRSYSSFVGEQGLTAEEIQLIADWVAAGVPQGNPDLEPPLPGFPAGSQLGTPDLVLEMAEAHFIEGNNLDDYRVFVLPTGLTEDKEIAAIEFRPGNTKAVHHALLAYEVNGAAADMDAQTPEYGYESFGNFGVPTQGSFTGYTPGIQTVLFPEGIGTTLPAGADLLMQVHYAPSPNDETDQSSLNIFFKKSNDPIERELDRLRVLPFNLDGGWLSFSIPPDAITSFHGTRDVTEDVSLISVYPHSHYLGKDWEIFAVTSANDTINIIRIEEWDFNWQGAYTFDRMKKVPAGSVIHINASYDNTLDNPYNPSNPPQTVTWGEGTTDEMYLVGMAYVPYQEGDEDIVIGDDPATNIEELTGQVGSRLFLPFPNPANSDVTLSFYLHKSQHIDIELFDVEGKKVQQIVRNFSCSAGNHKTTFNVRNLPSGIYTIRLSNAELVLTKPLVISE